MKWKTLASRRRSVPPAPTNDQVPYVAVFHTTDAFRYVRFKCDQFHGLLYLQIVQIRQQAAVGYSACRGSNRLRRLRACLAIRNGSRCSEFRGQPSESSGAEKELLAATDARPDVGRPRLVLLIGQNMHNSWSGYQWLIGHPTVEWSVPPNGVDALIGEPFKFEVRLGISARKAIAKFIFPKPGLNHPML